MTNVYNYYYDLVLADGKDFIDEAVENGDYNAETDFDDEVYEDMLASDEVCRNCSPYNYKYDDEMVMAALFDKDIMDGLRFDFNFGSYELFSRVAGKGDEGKDYLDAIIRCWMLGNVSPELETYFKNTVGNNGNQSFNCCWFSNYFYLSSLIVV